MRPVPDRSYEHAEARRNVEPARQTSHLAEAALRREAAGADVLILDLTDEPLEADAHVQGHAVDRPGVLHEHPEVGVQVLVRADRRVVDADRVGDAVAIELDEVAVDVVLEDVVTEGPVETGLEGVAAGDVRKDAGGRLRLRVDAVGRRNAAVDTPAA